MVIFVIKKGDYITRNSYGNDTVFLVLNIRGDTVYLKGVYARLYADSPLDDCVSVDKSTVEDDFRPSNFIDEVKSEDRSGFFYLPARILHLDGDSEYLKRCMDYYKQNKVFAIGRKIDEDTVSDDIISYLKDAKPDIVIITGHDAYMKKKGDKKDLRNYKNSLNFVKAVKNARKYESSHEKLIIIAGACQSNYEELIKAGANFASSPKRVNIHALDPAIIACNVALTEKSKEINLIELLEKTKNGEMGMGGIICNGMMYVGYPR